MVLDWLRASRPLNVLIIALIQYLLYFKLFWEDSIITQLSGHQVTALTIITSLITIGGYYINDYFDKETDQANSKENKHSISKKSLWIGYLLVSIIGLFLATNLALKIGKLEYVTLYVLAAALLYFYSAKAKGQGLLGNVIVSLFCVGGLLIILLAEWETFAYLQLQRPTIYLEKILILIGFSIFAGLITMIREVIKDIEDVIGDESAGIRTFVVRYGVKKAKLLTLIYTILTTLMTITWCFVSYHFYSLFALILFVFTIVLLLLFQIYLQVKASEKKHFAKISIGFKVVMINAIVYLFFA